MKYFDDYFKSNYEELLTYYPQFYADVFEMVEILKTFGFELDTIQSAVERVFFNGFVLYADAQTISVWERVLEIERDPALTLEQRRRVVLSRIKGFGHIGEAAIKEIIATYTDGAVDLDFWRGMVDITIEGEFAAELFCLDALQRRIPAHLGLAMRVSTRRESRLHLGVIMKGYLSKGGFWASAALPVYQSYHHLKVAVKNRADGAVAGWPASKDREFATDRNPPGGVYYQTHVKSTLIREE